MSLQQQQDTIEVPTDELTDFAWAVIYEMPSDNFRMYGVPDDLGIDDFRGNIGYADYEGDGIITFHGEFETKTQVGTLPASGGGRFEPPTNPPEPILEDIEVVFDLKLILSDGLARAEIEAERR